jgi:hypothetical protein
VDAVAYVDSNADADAVADADSDADADADAHADFGSGYGASGSWGVTCAGSHEDTGVFRALFPTPGGGATASVSHGSSMTSSAAAILAGSQAPASAAPTDAPSHPRIPTQSPAFAYLDALRQASNMENGSTARLSAKRPAPVTVSYQTPGVKRARPRDLVVNGPRDSLDNFWQNKVDRGFRVPSLEEVVSTLSQMQERERARTLGRRIGR